MTLHRAVPPAYLDLRRMRIVKAASPVSGNQWPPAEPRYHYGDPVEFELAGGLSFPALVWAWRKHPPIQLRTGDGLRWTGELWLAVWIDGITPEPMLARLSDVRRGAGPMLPMPKWARPDESVLDSFRGLM